MPEQTDPKATVPAANRAADVTVSRSDEPSVSHPATEPSFSAPAHRGDVGTFGRYRVLQKLGQGGMGAVYLGFDSALDRRVALKVMLPQHAADAGSRERFLREARAAAKVASDYVVNIFDVGEERGVPFIAMEYLLGSPLDQFLKTRGDLPLDQALRVARETALGLAAAHELGLIHRDIKPGNIWLSAPKGRVKILDFGLARAANDDEHLTGSGAVVGTPAYMSPEQGRGLRVDHRTDLFSLGVMLYRLTTGRMPFTGTGVMGVLTSLAVDTPAAPRSINPHLPEAVEAIITGLLAKNPAERFQTAHEVADALQTVETGPLPSVVAIPNSMAVGAQTQNVWEGIDGSRSISAPLADVPTENERPRPARWPRGPAVMAAGLLAALAVGGAFLAWPKAQRPRADAVTPPAPSPAPHLFAPEAPDADRAAAEWGIGRGGRVRVNGEPADRGTVAELPKARFVLTHIHLRNSKRLEGGLEPIKGLKGLTSVGLQNTNISDAALASLRGLKSLTELGLDGTAVTDEGLVYLEGLENLLQLGLRNTVVSGRGLAHLEKLRNLTWLDVRMTRVTQADADKLRAVLPGCRIEHDSGMIEPNAVADPDRKGAEWVLSIGGSVVIGTSAGERRPEAGGLPQERFGLLEVHLGGNARVTDQGMTALRGCKKLRYIMLYETPVTDAGLAHLAECEALAELHLGHTQVTDRGMAHFANCRNLTALSLPETKVGDAGLAHLKGCERLAFVNLNNTEAGDAGVEVFKACKGLKELHLGGARVSPEVVGALDGLGALTHLDLGNTRVSDDGLVRLGDRKSLTHLFLYKTTVSDAGLGHLKKLKNLASLKVGATKVTAEGVEDFRKAVPHCQIEWDDPKKP